MQVEVEEDGVRKKRRGRGAKFLLLLLHCFVAISQYFHDVHFTHHESIDRFEIKRSNSQPDKFLLQNVY